MTRNGMKGWRTFCTACALACGGLAAAADAGFAIYVSQDGDDASDGSAAAPLRTPGAARDRVRALKSTRGLPDGGVTVTFLDGIWRLAGPIELDARDSGEPGKPVVWKAANRTKAVLSGATRLVWRKPAADDPLLGLVPAASRKKIVVADMPGQGALPGYEGGFGQENAHHVALYANNGRRLPNALWPNEDKPDACYGKESLNLQIPGETTKEPPKSVDLFVDDSVSAARLAAWAKEPDLWIWSAWKFRWADSTVRIRKSDPASRTLAVDGNAVQYGVVRGNDNGGVYRLRNAFSEIDMPGEWAADRANRRLYLMSPKGVSISVTAADAMNLVTCTGVSDLAFEGFLMEGSRADAAVFSHCTNTALRASVVRGTGGWAVQIRDCVRSRVDGCDLYDIGEGGVSLSGGERRTLTPAENEVENCHIHHIGRQVYNYRPGVQLMGVGNRCRHNLIHHTRHAAIIFTGNDQYMGFNVIHDVCFPNFDCGAIYTHTKTDWCDRGHVVEWNMVHMAGRPRNNVSVMACYIDGWSSGITVRHNIVSRAVYGFFQNGGNDNEYSCNIALCCNDPIRRNNLGLEGGKTPYPTYGGIGRDSTLYRNLLKDLELYRTPLWRTRYPKMLSVLDFEDPVWAHNSLYSVITNNVMAMGGPPVYIDSDQMKGLETITNNVEFADDPGFVDYAGFNWELKPDSPARKTLGGGTRWAEMGLYAGPWRVSPPVKVGKGITPVFYERDLPPPIANVRAVFKGRRPEGEQYYMKDMTNCSSSLVWWPNGNVVNCVAPPLPIDGQWVKCRFSFTPLVDAEVRIEAGGWRGEKTIYDDFEATGCELLDPGFEENSGAWTTAEPDPAMARYGCIKPPYGVMGALPGGGKPRTGKGLLLANVYLVTSQDVKVKKDVPVTITFWSRAYAP